MKTFAVKLRKEMRISGEEFPADCQIGAITSEVNPMDLLGLIQYHHAFIEEVTDAEDDSQEDGDDLPEEQLPLPLVDGDSSEAAEKSATAEANQTEPSQLQPEAESQIAPIDDTAAIAKFVADGLDEKTARALVVTNKIKSPEELKGKLADPFFNLGELDEIGATRQQKIMAIYLA